MSTKETEKRILITHKIKDLMSSSEFGVVSKNQPFISKRKHRICQLERKLEIIKSSLLLFFQRHLLMSRLRG